MTRSVRHRQLDIPDHQLDRQQKWLTTTNVEGTAGVSGTPLGLLLVITHDGAASPDTDIPIGHAGKGFWVKKVTVHVTEAFNGGSDSINIGHDANNSAYASSVSLTSTGIQSFTPTQGIESQARRLIAYYTASANPSTGRALIIIEHFRTP